MTMQTLGLMDQMFYKADQHLVARMVMGGASILAPARGKRPLEARLIADHMAARLEKVPLLRMKFVQDPLRIGSVAKVEDPDFDIRDHILLRALPAPGDYRQLTEALGDAVSQPLDIHDLWRWTLFDGLEGGRVALLCQMHHALFDGLGAVEVLSSMYDAKPVTPEKPLGASYPAPEEPTPYALLGDAIAESTRRLVVKIPQFVRHNTLPILGALADGAADLLKQGRQALPDMPEVTATSLNTGTASGTRAVAYKTLSLPELKLLTRHYQCTVNDMGLLLFSFALEHYFRETGEKIDFDLVCGMPISTRTGDSTAGNQVTAAMISLHNTVGDPVARLRAIQADALESKRKARPEEPAIDTGALGELVSPLLMEGLMFLAGRIGLMERVGGRFPVFNALLSNVPGPRETVYVGNALLVESIPLIPAVDVVALSGGITSCGDTITFGFHCDGERILNPELLVEGVEHGLRALDKARKPGAAAGAKRKTRPKAKRKVPRKNARGAARSKRK